MQIQPDENLISLRDAVRLVPRSKGRCVHVSTIYRWTMSGSRGVRLEFVQTPGGRCTSREAIHRFFRRLTAATLGDAIVSPTRRARNREIRDAEETLEDDGI